ncbi:Spy/CpxP family protein refolding chaperone [Microvirga terricola]|uniref:Spy/CpxP family protein refolding chaperone n=1 Tax=Microvirga terricola TaxID=2719797 RepID=A0ABX0VEK3_9HYPH|nr:Spy/CpxP family protein refolding chaperone [Microvirga terricola]NIX78264.1 Spy/CpxP family protein refolding chaperone [Microvirga terricola]
MKRWIVGTLLAGTLLAMGGAASAQQRGMTRPDGMGPMGRPSPEDMDAFRDARIAALHAGLKLTPDQEKLWPPVEDAIRNLAKVHREHMKLMMEGGIADEDAPRRIKALADRLSQSADALRKLADAATPLYATFDDAQKRRLRVLVHGMGMGMAMQFKMMHPGHGMMPGMHEEEEEEDN